MIRRRTGGALLAVIFVAQLGWGSVAAATWSGRASATLPPVGSYRSTIVMPSSLQRGEMVAADPLGNVYVTDYSKGSVLQVAPGGGVRDIRPSGVGLTRGIATDDRGNLFVIGESTGRLVKVSPGGVETVMSVPGLASDGGSFDALAVDPRGNLYIGDCSRDRIIKRTPAGAFTFIPGRGACYGQFGVDLAGNLFLPDRANHRVIRIAAANGAVTTVGFTGLSWPQGVTVDRDGNVYVLDEDGSVRKSTPGGQQVIAEGITGAYSGIDIARDGSVVVATDDQVVSISAGEKRIVRMSGVSGAADTAVGSNGHVYLADPGGGRVLDFAPDGTQAQLPLAGVDRPIAVAAASDGRLFVVDGADQTVVVRSPAGVVADFAIAGVDDPFDVAVGGEGTIFVLDATSDSTSDLVRRTPTGSVSTMALPRNFDPGAVAADGSGNAYVSCTGFFCAVQVLELMKSGGTRVVTTNFEPGYGRAHMAVDDTGTVYVTGTGTYGSQIERITPGGVRSQINAPYRSDNTFPTPDAIAVDREKNLFVFDPQVGLVRMAPQSGVPSAVATPTVSTTGLTTTVRWTAPAANGTVITGYQVAEFDQSGFVGVHPVGPTARSATVTGRLSDVRRFRVSAVTAAGPGPQSPSSQTVVTGWGLSSSFVDRQARDSLGRAPTTTELWQLVALLESQVAGYVPMSLRVSIDAVQNVDPVTRLYWAYFQRTPDRAGLVYWIGQRRSGLALTKISSQFAGSREFVQLYGGRTNRGFVELVYANVLERAPDQAGLAYWTAELDARRSTRGGVMIGFSESAEFVQKKRAEVDFVAAMSALLRTGPSDAELADRAAALRSGDTTLVDLMQDLLVDPRYPR